MQQQAQQQVQQEKEVGRISYWNFEKGFGFVYTVEGKTIHRYFLHASEILSGEPKRDAVVRFYIEAKAKGLAAVFAEIESTKAAA